jgi:hypothetical protein
MWITSGVLDLDALLSGVIAAGGTHVVGPLLVAAPRAGL